MLRSAPFLPFGIRQTANQAIAAIADIMNARRWRMYSWPSGVRRIYHYHVRKAAGTSLNHMFLSLGGGEGAKIYRRMAGNLSHSMVSNGLVFVGWGKALIERGNFHYAFSHTPAHELSLKPETFTVTCLRDPVDRVVSHYRMICEYRDAADPRPDMKVEYQWLGASFRDFLRRIPKEHLLRQLFMFSGSFNQNEAVERILQCSYVIFTDQFATDCLQLANILGVHLTPIHIRKGKSEVVLPQADLNQLRDLLEPEYQFYQAIRTAKR